MIPSEMHSIVRKYAEKSFKGAMLFQVAKGHMILTYPVNRNPDYESRIQDIFGPKKL